MAAEVGLDEAAVKSDDFLRFFSGDLTNSGNPSWATPYALTIMGEPMKSQCAELQKRIYFLKKSRCPTSPQRSPNALPSPRSAPPRRRAALVWHAGGFECLGNAPAPLPTSLRAPRLTLGPPCSLLPAIAGATPKRPNRTGPFGNGNGYGDGRAISIGEVVVNGSRWEFQLKGAGPTPFCRGADGRVPELRHHFGPFFADFSAISQLHPTPHVLWAVFYLVPRLTACRLVLAIRWYVRFGAAGGAPVLHPRIPGLRGDGRARGKS